MIEREEKKKMHKNIIHHLARQTEKRKKGYDREAGMARRKVSALLIVGCLPSNA